MHTAVVWRFGNLHGNRRFICPSVTSVDFLVTLRRFAVNACDLHVPTADLFALPRSIRDVQNVRSATGAAPINQVEGTSDFRKNALKFRSPKRVKSIEFWQLFISPSVLQVFRKQGLCTKTSNRVFPLRIGCSSAVSFTGCSPVNKCSFLIARSDATGRVLPREQPRK
ncbi:hypothetical protein CEXT_409531 [Caerostris extrusa]|uniref:Uncharacterized protein n=1 Tax=Caerostris extrusa TaxID=172846 RepID=A0AAV4TN57_CAEEX|nr:hypothetical protein CEXT_409531 [Caerostris extrusa]